MSKCKFSQKLGELRAAKGVTQQEVAEYLSISNKTVSKWENGDATPDLDALISLSQYFDVSCDYMLGIANSHAHRDAAAAVFEELADMDVTQTISAAFDVAKAIVPAMYVKLSQPYDCGEVITTPTNEVYPSMCISTENLFNFVINSDEANMAVALLKNKCDFAWMKDSEKQKDVAEFFKILSIDGALTVSHFIHSKVCPEYFTANFVAENTGVTADVVTEILDGMCGIGECYKKTAQLAEGEVAIYNLDCRGVALAVITLVYGWINATGFEYCYSGTTKMIRGEKK